MENNNPYQAFYAINSIKLGTEISLWYAKKFLYSEIERSIKEKFKL